MTALAELRAAEKQAGRAAQDAWGRYVRASLAWYRAVVVTMEAEGGYGDSLLDSYRRCIATKEREVAALSPEDCEQHGRDEKCAECAGA